MSHAHRLMEICRRAEREGRTDKIEQAGDNHLKYLDDQGNQLAGDGQLKVALANGWIEQTERGWRNTERGDIELERFSAEQAAGIALRLLTRGAAFSDPPQGSCLLGLTPQQRITFLVECATGADSLSPIERDKRYQWLEDEMVLWYPATHDSQPERSKESKALMSKMTAKLSK